jgi:FAD/FMN-containing dehydrogenase
MIDQRIITTDGSERVIGGAAIHELVTGLRGRLLCCDDPGYEAARKVWNGMVDKRPALIASCAGTADVVSCVRFAREYDALVSVRGGGHHYTGKSVCAGAS